MIDRRQVVGGVVLGGAAALFGATAAQAQDYKAKYP